MPDGTHRETLPAGQAAPDRGRWLAVAGVLAAAAVCVAAVLPWSPADRWLRQAEAALAAHQFSRAAKLAERVLDVRPGSSHAWLLAGYAQAGMHRSDEAIRCFLRVPQDGSGAQQTALRGLAERYQRRGRLAAAERCLRQALQLSPFDSRLHFQLGKLLRIQGRAFESIPHLRHAMQAGLCKGEHLMWLGSSEIVALGPGVDESKRAEPDQLRPHIQWAMLQISANNHDSAADVLRKVVARHPDELEAQGRLGQLLCKLPEQFADWHGKLPEGADEHPEVWVARGLRAAQDEQLRAAARCFWEAVRRQPCHLAANHQLARVLFDLGRPGEAERFAERARLLDKLTYALADATGGASPIEKLVPLLESMGRCWEAAAWAQLVRNANPDLRWPRTALLRLRPRLLESRELLHSPSPPEQAAALSGLAAEPLPRWRAGSPAGGAAPSASPDHQIRFADDAPEAGLSFQYYNGADDSGERVYFFEFSGGAAAVLDFDQDGWPDIYLTQGCRWPLDPSQTEHLDRLFRNRGDGTFEDVTAAAGLGDNGMSQGAAVGDINNDGFPDLHVGNLGGNRLYCNNGDGTFRELATAAPAAADDWTTSSVLADVNQDGLPDLYVVNYLLKKAIDKQCEDRGRPVQCGPTQHEAAQDRLFVNRGGERFQELAEAAGIVRADGKGLGVVAGDFDNSGKLSLFVANDTTSNFFFANQTSRPGADPQFGERAMMTGLARDEWGTAQACMGVAAGDADGDGLLDLFVTNFYDESNAFYVQRAPLSFRDRASQAGIRGASFKAMGWGTQFLDADLDGLPDLVLVNGHINDFREQGTPYQMPAQLMRNVGDGNFVEADAAQLGDYFQRPLLGRGLSRLDWNRDGREDFAATHVDAPVALLTNRTEPAGHFLSLRLAGTDSSRDAIGATATVEAGGRRQTRQLTAGDGFYASNERILVFGLGAAERIDRLTIRWPAGGEQTFRDVAADQRLLAIEGGGELVSLEATPAP